MLKNKSVKEELYMALYVFLVGLFFFGLGYIQHSFIGFFGIFFFVAAIIAFVWALIHYLLKIDQKPIKVLSDKQASNRLRLMWLLVAIVSIFVLWDFLKPH